MTQEEMVSGIIGLWELYAEKYRTNPIEYEFLKKVRKELKLPINAISRDILDGYIEVRVLRIVNRGEVMAYLSALSESELCEVQKAIDDLLNKFAFDAIAAWLTNSRRLINHYGEKYHCSNMKPGVSRKIGRRSYIMDEDRDW